MWSGLNQGADLRPRAVEGPMAKERPTMNKAITRGYQSKLRAAMAITVTVCFRAS